MEQDIQTRQKQSVSAFWKAYFAKFRRRAGDREASGDMPAPQTAKTDSPLPFPDRRRSRTQRFELHR
jgi:hypothetical protein